MHNDGRMNAQKHYSIAFVNNIQVLANAMYSNKLIYYFTPQKSAPWKWKENLNENLIVTVDEVYIYHIATMLEKTIVKFENVPSWFH